MLKIADKPLVWKPRPYQRAAWIAWERGIRRELLIWHRRAGKDEVALHKTAVAMHPPPGNRYSNMRIGNYWHCLPMFEQARKAIWEAVNPHTGRRRIDEAFPRELRAHTRNDTMSIEFKSGSHWRVVGSDNPDSLVGAPPVGIVFSEWDLSNPSAWLYLAPILAENGGWASFITTPRGRGNAYKFWMEHRANPSWFCERLTVDDTGVVPRDRIEADRHDYIALFGRDAADVMIQQEYWCSFEAAILGAYWGKELAQADLEGRICEVKSDPLVPVQTAWDLGVDDATAIWWFQAVGGRILILDYYEAHGYAVQHYAEAIKQRAADRGWKRGTDWVPHDAKQREFSSRGHDDKAKQRIEVMVECGLQPRVVTNHTVIDGISAGRQILPRCVFDAERCAEGLEALRQYRADWDDDLKVFKKTPLHDWASHGSDAFRYLAMAYRELAPEQRKAPDRTLQIGGIGAKVGALELGGVTLEDIWAANRRGSWSRRKV